MFYILKFISRCGCLMEWGYERKRRGREAKAGRREVSKIKRETCVFGQITRCISTNCKMYLYNLWYVFVQIEKIIFLMEKCICANCKMYLSKSLYFLHPQRSEALRRRKSDGKSKKASLEATTISRRMLSAYYFGFSNFAISIHYRCPEWATVIYFKVPESLNIITGGLFPG